ncbi:MULTISPECIES: pyridoxal phosphate-dependent decarboxylase family protein [unclassified Coleofasciculus]|uniref:pyridoxal phosphate-dependent decarboxylase family protein n=1 Tax=unclassified Coleofasciculus TaxID=2692782 RepID=UPI00187FA80B|nr:MULTISPECIES: aspartate aminotransferase family protein [unclassified Coleofasciculus]MBE9125225.1 aspartate aminotransferase family protein [Coleofasciculus sp. LEGE 07081]MBE9148422.1 aspartate aminotransferase family protein [Coleofasciculus sp. LEGE 07092]
MLKVIPTPRQSQTCFLSDSGDSISAYRDAIATAQEVLIDCFANQTRPYSGANPDELAAMLAASEVCPETGKQLKLILNYVGETILNNSVVVSHPTCIAHLHCPPLTAALAAEVLISATNQSMDSWDQSPAATVLEQRVVDWLCRLFGYGEDGDGVFTSGGTQSNFMGLLLARDRYVGDRFGWSVQQQGLPPESSRLRILSSAASHFTIRQAAALLGLGEQAVVRVETDADYRLCPVALERELAQLSRQNLLPIALVATVGTTDFGSIDPLPELAALAKQYGLWLHVDAAYGGALILSDRHRHKLAGIELADSITVDFHKLFYQPISCGAFLLKDRSHFNAIALHADYLNPKTNAEAGIPDLVTKSVQTTRRFDALKLYVSLQALGRQGFAELIDTTINLATETARLIDAEPVLELANQPEINAVVFRYCPQKMSADANVINRPIRASLMRRGEAVLAQTQIGDRVYLKFTLLNPHTNLEHISGILTSIKHLGNELESAGALT